MAKKFRNKLVEKFVNEFEEENGTIEELRLKNKVNKLMEQLNEAKKSVADKEFALELAKERVEEIEKQIFSLGE